MMREYNIMRGKRRLVGFVNSAIMHGEYYAEIIGTDTKVVFNDKKALEKWVSDLGLRLE